MSNNTIDKFKILISKQTDIIRAKSRNIWYKIKLSLMCIFAIMVFYFTLVNPYVLKAQMSNNAGQKESDIMYTIHELSPTKDVKFFDVVPIIGGDRIFTVKYLVENSNTSCNEVKTALLKLDWASDADNANQLKKDSSIVIIKPIDKTTLKVTIASIETIWGMIHLKANQLW